MKKTAWLLSLLISLSTGAFSQTAVSAENNTITEQGVNHADVVALQRSYLQLQQQKIVLDNLQLTEQESDAFWPVFRSYQNEFELIGDRLVALIVQFTEKFESMTDEEATSMLKEAQDIQQAENELKRSYVEKFSQVLPPKKVLRFYQIDNKMRTEIRHALSLEIPLLESSQA